MPPVFAGLAEKSPSPPSASRARIVGAAKAPMTATFSLAVIFFGVPLGTQSPCRLHSSSPADVIKYHSYQDKVGGVKSTCTRPPLLAWRGIPARRAGVAGHRRGGPESTGDFPVARALSIGGSR